ncbi:hypothetical protein NOQ67_002659 [Enterococcus faecalis]|uniref:DUF7006 family protein n=1 Tax=Enterococcus faecalis TaxID=1351 RepID=UPI0013D4225F|nr:hypothetical protein [Enterococcus faecalis]EJM6036344.1 hypothetical protein [Enterococcus faecalis]NFA65112.1 hypothetical protein [Enterococcus faecalis]HAP3019067.1 hypothetical protein [Enterococcus faecalis]
MKLIQDKNQHKLILEAYLKIKHGFHTELQHVDSTNFFKVMKKVLELDAQLQILVAYLNYDFKTLVSEEEIVQITFQDYQTYYKELLVDRLDEPTPHTILTFN